jgi:hypothetical protein
MRRWIAMGLLAAVLGTALPGMVLASSEGRRNTALGLTGLSVYELVNHNTTSGILAGAGAIYAWSRYSQAHRAEQRARRARYYASHPVYYSSYPHSRVAGYRSFYSSRGYYGPRYSQSRRHSATYLAGYRAGYNRGIRVARAQL